MNWPHYASDDLESMTPVAFNTQDVPPMLRDMEDCPPEYVDGLCPPASDDLDAMTPVAFNPRSSAVSIDWRDKVAFDTRSVLEDFARGCSPSCTELNRRHLHTPNGNVVRVIDKA